MQDEGNSKGAKKLYEPIVFVYTETIGEHKDAV